MIPSSISDTIGLEDTKFEDGDSVDGSATDGLEHIFNSTTQLRYGRDLRLNELSCADQANNTCKIRSKDLGNCAVSCCFYMKIVAILGSVLLMDALLVRHLLCSARPVAIQTSVNPTTSDQDLQQDLQQLAQRTTALPLGHGAFTLATTSTLLTEVNLDPNLRNVPELKSWPEFHNVVAVELRLAPIRVYLLFEDKLQKLSRTWIIYNKEEPNVIHAGLLLALDLHGHLHVLTITDMYQYYLQEHESMTVGLMLGLAASYWGIMQPAISKSLYVHIPARHPSSFPELELPTLLQSAALMSVGLLYVGSAHPQTMHILVAEICRRSGGDNVLEREGYVVSARFSLGLVALGGKEPRNVYALQDCFERSLLVTLSADDHNHAAGQMMDGMPVNVDVTARGTIMALALMFLKSESELVFYRLSIPRTHFELQYVKPDFIMLRVIARNLIMWSRVHPSKDWIQSQIPEIVQNGIRGLGDEVVDVDEMDAEAFVQAYVNIVVGSCISIGLRFAGTENGDAQELLYDYAIYFLDEVQPPQFVAEVCLILLDCCNIAAAEYCVCGQDIGHREGAVDTPAYGCIMLINGSDSDFQEFCLQVLFECVSKDRPALLQLDKKCVGKWRKMGTQEVGGYRFLVSVLWKTREDCLQPLRVILALESLGSCPLVHVLCLFSPGIGGMTTHRHVDVKEFAATIDAKYSAY
ncbi:hypothetical protein RHSIM_Rhsim10G0095300 [Rhododendron simsii]|uniref:Anaphase-promoting complex subunit 1 n=1 Tax=Rhododendron simsii TaxID=118357 RepID=A0A834GFI6_RHOSS|nr:hypothetical protein RHSIM_Rhsim10G0095300 [Rhododendron simsii]